MMTMVIVSGIKNRQQSFIIYEDYNVFSLTGKVDILTFWIFDVLTRAEKKSCVRYKINAVWCWQKIQS